MDGRERSKRRVSRKKTSSTAVGLSSSSQAVLWLNPGSDQQSIRFFTLNNFGTVPLGCVDSFVSEIIGLFDSRMLNWWRSCVVTGNVFTTKQFGSVYRAKATWMCDFRGGTTRRRQMPRVEWKEQQHHCKPKLSAARKLETVKIAYDQTPFKWWAPLV